MAMIAVALAFSGILVGISLYEMSRLAGLQDEGFRKTQTQAIAAGAAHIGARYSQVMADAIINRNLDESRKLFSELGKEAAKDLDRLAADADTPEERQSVAAARQSIEKLSVFFENRLLPALNDKNRVAVDIGALDEEVDLQLKGIRGQLMQVAQSMHHEAEKADREFDATRVATVRYTAVVSLLAALALIVFAWFTIRSIMAPLTEAQEVAARIADGSLATAVVTARGDEFGTMLRSLERMRLSLCDIAQEIQSGSNDIAATSSELASTTGQISQASSSQSEAAAAMAASVEEMSVSIAHVSDRADDVRKAAHDSGNDAEMAATAVGQLLGQNNRTSETVEAAAGHIRDLGAMSERISSIVQVIREVADQTNLLALNAAIEAARAGEQGRGFAVVADEVRKLAERTSNSTSEISAVVNEVQQAAQAVVGVMEKVVAEEKNSLTLSTSVNELIAKLRSGSSSVAIAVGEITGALREQTTASTDIARRVEMIAQMSEENHAAVGETASAANNLESLAARLQTVSNRFVL